MQFAYVLIGKNPLPHIGGSYHRSRKLTFFRYGFNVKSPRAQYTSMQSCGEERGRKGALQLKSATQNFDFHFLCIQGRLNLQTCQNLFSISILAKIQKLLAWKSKQLQKTYFTRIFKKHRCVLLAQNVKDQCKPPAVYLIENPFLWIVIKRIKHLSKTFLNFYKPYGQLQNFLTRLDQRFLRWALITE